MELHSIHALSPLDGRYFQRTRSLAFLFSEASLIRFRIHIETLYLQALSTNGVVRPFSNTEQRLLRHLGQPTEANLQQIKDIELTTHHDVKAVEYYLANVLSQTSLCDCTPYIHIGLTSEDVNNLAHRLMVAQAEKEVLKPALFTLLQQLANMASAYAALPMLARTHGQPAIPTTLGKEVAVFGMRLLKQLQRLESLQLTGKVNGAAGSYQALHLIQPHLDWVEFSKQFIQSLGLQPNLHTTQINPADDVIDLFHIYHVINSILIDLDQDFWRYISDSWMIQSGKKQDVGSSTMPQKINPIEFENSEGNLTLANGLIETMSRKLPISRLQRDLSDSTMYRNIGSLFGYCLLGYTNVFQGLKSVVANTKQIETDLDQNYAILAEALQTKLRYQQQSQAYEQVASLVKEQKITQKKWQKITQKLDPTLISLTPQRYIGLATSLTHQAVQVMVEFLNRKAE